MFLEVGVEMEADTDLDGLARGARWRDDDDSARRWLGGDERLAVGRQVVVANLSLHELESCKDDAAGGMGWSHSAGGVWSCALLQLCYGR